MEKGLLAELLGEGLSLDAIGERVSRSPSTVSYWLKRHGLKANGAEKYGSKAPLAKEELASLIAEGLSTPAIAERLGCTTSLVRYWLVRHGLQTRQSRNRALVRVARARGERSATLVCLHHGLTEHVIENDGGYKCARCRAKQVAAHRRKIKRLLVAEAGGACRLCGYDRCVAALQFHHMEPHTKSFQLSLRGVTKSIERIREEAGKCLLLCANCHAEVESGFRSDAI